MSITTRPSHHMRSMLFGYPPECLEGRLYELRMYGVLRRSAVPGGSRRASVDGIMFGVVDLILPSEEDDTYAQ
jgi:hypothetical protein